MEKFDNYLVSQITANDVDALLLASSHTEKLPGSFMVGVYANATIIERSMDENALPFRAVRFFRDGHVPVTKFRAGDVRYLVIDPPEPGVTIDGLDENDRAHVRGERA